MFDARRDVRLALQGMTVLVSGLEANRDRLAEAVADPLLLATDVAEELVRGGVPFREAHEQVAASVRDGSYRPVGSAAESVAARPAPGPGDVAEAIAAARRRFGAATRDVSTRTSCARSTARPVTNALRRGVPRVETNHRRTSSA